MNKAFISILSGAGSVLGGEREILEGALPVMKGKVGSMAGALQIMAGALTIRRGIWGLLGRDSRIRGGTLWGKCFLSVGKWGGVEVFCNFVAFIVL